MRVCQVVIAVMIALFGWLPIARAADPVGGGFVRGYLGVEVRDLTKEEAESLGWETPRGVKVVKPFVGSPAEKADLKTDDVVVSLDGVEVQDMKSFVASVGVKAAGSAVKLRLLRAGKERSLVVVLVPRPAEQPVVVSQEPSPLVPMLDTGGHMAIIRGLKFTPDGKFIVSASNDKVVRVWDWRAGKTIRTIRGEATAGDHGKLYALALSRDGTKLAVAGFMRGDDNEIRLYDFASGALTGLFIGHKGVVHSVAFSPDGNQLLSGSGLEDQTAILWDVRKREVIHRLRGHTSNVYDVAFSADGLRAVTASYDKSLRLWRLAGPGSNPSQPAGAARTAEPVLIAELKGHGERVRSVSLSPRDGTIASGDESGEIRLWDGMTGKMLRVISPPTGSGVGPLKFSPDGTRLLSGNGGGKFSCHVWDVATGRELVTYTGHDNIVLAGDISPDGRYAATGGGGSQEIHVWELETGKRVLGPDSRDLSMRGTGRPGWAVGFSTDGERIAWGRSFRYKNHNDRGVLEYQLRLPVRDGDQIGQPEPVSQPDAGWQRAETKIGKISLAHRKGGRFGYDAILDVKRDEATIASIELDSTNGLGHYSYTLLPDGKSLISGGGTGEVAAFDYAGKPIGDYIGHEGTVWAVAPSPDGRFLLSSSHDQTMRLWNLKTRELIVTIFHGTEGQWVIYTPQGYYTSSPGADSLIGWQINKGKKIAPDYVTAAQLRTQFYRPDIVDRSIILASASEAVEKSEGTQFKLEDLLARPVPSLRFLSPADGSKFSSGSAVLKLAFTPTPDPVKNYTVRVNGTQVATVALTAAERAKGELSLDVPLAKGTNTVVVTLSNAVGDSSEAAGTITLVHEGEGALDKRGKLYVLAIGVDQYKDVKKCGPDGDQPCNLSYSGSDASAFAEAMVKALGPSHDGAPNVQVLTNAFGQTPPTAANILAALSNVKNRSQANDTLVVFVAGHGVLDDADYVFLPTDAQPDDKRWNGATVVPWVNLENAVFGAKGRRFLFVDTCHAAGAYNGKLGNNAYHNDVVAFTATGQDQKAIEFDALEHGVFTYAIMKGLGEGEADTDSSKVITVDKLGAYLKLKASDLIKSNSPLQPKPWPIPELHKARDAGNHVIARMK